MSGVTCTGFVSDLVISKCYVKGDGGQKSISLYFKLYLFTHVLTLRGAKELSLLAFTQDTKDFGL